MEPLKLDTPFYSNDLREKTTLRGYFQKLLLTLWDELDSFSGKRPFGDSSWDAQLGLDLAKAGIIKSVPSEWDDEGYDETELDQVVIEAINSL